jgi:hypothetical protein
MLASLILPNPLQCLLKGATRLRVELSTQVISVCLAVRQRSASIAKRG